MQPAPEEFRRLGHQLIDQLADFLLQSASDQDQPVPVLDYRDPDELYRQWQQRIARGIGPEQLFADVLAQSVRLHHPGYLGHQISPPAPVAALAGLVGDFVNNGMGVYEMGMAGTVLERLVVERVAQQLGFGDSSGGFLTSGGSLANLTALLAARARATGHIAESDPLALLVSGDAHYCVQRAVAVMGWGRSGLVRVPVDSRRRMRVDRLPRLLAETRQQGRHVIAVVGSACSTATGSYDDLREIGAFCRQHGIWFHVDGAHGAAVAFSQKYRELLAGIDQADSVTLDFHKLLLTPALATALVFRDGLAGYRTFAQEADYLFDDPRNTHWHNLALRTFECTKLMMSVKIASILFCDGPQVWEDNVTQLYDRAREMASMIEQRDELQLLLVPQSNIVCYRFAAADEDSLNRVNRDIRAALVRQGRFYIVQTVIDGTTWLRSTVASRATTTRTLEQLLSEICRLGNRLSGGRCPGEPAGRDGTAH